MNGLLFFKKYKFGTGFSVRPPSDQSQIEGNLTCPFLLNLIRDLAEIWP